MTANEALASYLNSLEPKERAYKTRDICKFCKKTKYVFYNWIHGRSRIDLAWRDKITQAIAENTFKNVTD